MTGSPATGLLHPGDIVMAMGSVPDPHHGRPAGPALCAGPAIAGGAVRRRGRGDARRRRDAERIPVACDVSMFGSGDPDNPMGGLLGDLLKVIGSAPGGGDTWFDAARTLAHGVATDGRGRRQRRPARPHRLRRAGPRGRAARGRRHRDLADRRGRQHLVRRRRARAVVVPRRWSAYRPTLQLMVEAQQQGAAAMPPPPWTSTPWTTPRAASAGS